MGIGERIKAARIERGLTQKQLGELCGMADSAIRRYESDRGNPTEKTIWRIASALDMEPWELRGYGGGVGSGTGFEDGTGYGGGVGCGAGFDDGSGYDGSIRVHVSPEQHEYSELLQKKKNGSITPDELNRLLELYAKRPPLSESIKKLEDMLDRLGQCMKMLNPVGQQKVEDYAQDLTRIPEYQATQSPVTPPEGTDTTPPLDGTEGQQEDEEGTK